MKIDVCRMEFSGKLLKRGFWLYIWDIKEAVGNKRRLYVGRTGDNSSVNASSPFRRIGQHLDTRPNAKANALGRRLKSAEVNPELCTFEMIAIGPIFDEQHTESAHYPLRDETAALERALAEELKRRGYDVLGTHQCSGQPNSELLKQVLEKVDRLFPSQQVEVARFPRYQPIQLRGDGPSASEIIMRDRGRL